MKKKDIAAIIAKNTHDIVYACDIDTYDLYFLNDVALEGIEQHRKGISPEGKCYNVLQGKDEPCDFCTNHKLKTDEFYVWKHYNPISKKYYILKDKEIIADGKRIRIEFATDITDEILAQKSLAKDLKLQETLNGCAHIMNKGQDPHKAIREMFVLIGEYYDADRVQLFRISSTDFTVSVTEEWCKEGVSSEKELFKNVPREAFESILEVLQLKETIYIDGENIYPMINDEYIEEEHLADNIRRSSSIFITGIENGGEEYKEYLLVENVDKEFEEDELLKMLTGFINNFLIREELLEKLNTLSFMDNLTGLKNRHSYREFLARYQQTPPKVLGVIYVDINGLKIINDTYGHGKGDDIIVKLAEILMEIFEDGVFRVGGDEFVILCENITAEEFERKIKELREKVDKATLLKVSIGSSWNSEYGDVINQIEEADSSMYVEKQGRQFSYDINEKYGSMLTKTLLGEIEDGKFTVFFQPQIDLRTNTIAGAEALVRKISNQGEIMPPDTFVPFYEKEGIIKFIDVFVFEEVCKFLSKTNQNKDNEHIKISVNFSKMTLATSEIVEELKKLCVKYNVKNEQIIIEITETARTIKGNELEKTIKRFSKEGFFVSLDDFGSGHANLSMLTNLDFDEIKIDKSLIDDLEESQKSKILTKLAIDICVRLDNIASTAEGVETIEQFNILKEMLCKKGQGYYFDKPMTEENFLKKYIKNI